MRFLVLVCDSVSGAVQEQHTCSLDYLGRLVQHIASVSKLSSLRLSIRALEEDES